MKKAETTFGIVDMAFVYSSLDSKHRFIYA